MKTIAQIIGAVVLIAALVLAVPVIHYFPMYNFRTVEEGAFYGSRQMGGKAMERIIKKRGIGTVINLRGEQTDSDWYDREVAACKHMGIQHVNFGWSKNSIPEPESLAAFLDLMETGQKPFLAHCQGGTHRTGVAAAVYLLLKGADTATARKQFRIGFNDAPIGELVTLYEGSPKPFKQWVLEDYPAKYEQWKKQREAQKEAAKVPALLAASALR
ncbi:MAG TPA: tyrosine-protein phosphatase [Candidatus Hydrogenedentes bacterium]|nr:MAG: hypothetical protein BWY07_00570 [Candidatus Hydrogenedentes bacterium ADurb.Bin170]HOD94277.1 tyrosine-protein phosphatase [Candidatus Hydrogenedentota bacterium]HOH43844.1 tyrosine-protein phosphatase [Candidatus Hydrogenedentota bacterium]HOM48120.1 tyrosine-protein phosphatase [Candidatus Hydrogenedentota bacterium]HOR49937.1 tyrosine-protein phosphatase [Candidatus Hydrogenedentota bacterium]